MTVTTISDRDKVFTPQSKPRLHVVKGMNTKNCLRVFRSSPDGVYVQTRLDNRYVGITLTCRKKAATLVIEDDGRGFDARNVAAGRHGLIGMRERARAAGGTLRLTTGKTGTRIVVKVPA